MSQTPESALSSSRFPTGTPLPATNFCRGDGGRTGQRLSPRGLRAQRWAPSGNCTNAPFTRMMSALKSVVGPPCGLACGAPSAPARAHRVVAPARCSFRRGTTSSSRPRAAPRGCTSGRATRHRSERACGQGQTRRQRESRRGRIVFEVGRVGLEGRRKAPHVRHRPPLLRALDRVDHVHDAIATMIPMIATTIEELYQREAPERRRGSCSLVPSVSPEVIKNRASSAPERALRIGPA